MPPRYPLAALLLLSCGLGAGEAAAVVGTAPSVAINCGDAFDDRLKWLCSFTTADGVTPLLKICEIGPADAPRYALVGGELSLYICRDEPAAPLSLRLPSGTQLPPSELWPAGCTAHVLEASQFDDAAMFDRSLPLPLRGLPPFRPRLHVSRAADDGGSDVWCVGRAGMAYRDLLPDRAGGSVIVSHIKIESGGDVPDYVHFHRVRFQMIYVLRGWVEVVYEGQGPPFVLRPGDFVTQLPTIRHRVLRCSDGLEVLEVSAPAEHATLADHDHMLPDGVAAIAPLVLGGQHFVRHDVRHDESQRDAWTRDTPPHGEELEPSAFAWLETPVGDATTGLARVRIGRAASSDDSSARSVIYEQSDGKDVKREEEAAMVVVYVVAGVATMEVDEAEDFKEELSGAPSGGLRTLALAEGDCVSLPAGLRFCLTPASAATRIVEVRLRGE